MSRLSALDPNYQSDRFALTDGRVSSATSTSTSGYCNEGHLYRHGRRPRWSYEYGWVEKASFVFHDHEAPRLDHHPSRVAGRAPFPAGAVVGRAVHQSLPDPPRGGRPPNRKGRRMSAYNKKYG